MTNLFSQTAADMVDIDCIVQDWYERKIDSALAIFKIQEIVRRNLLPPPKASDRRWDIIPPDSKTVDEIIDSPHLSLRQKEEGISNWLFSHFEKTSE